MTIHPYRFGVHLGRVSQAGGRDELAEQVRQAEALGYDTITVPDHPTGHVMWGPFLATVADISPAMRIGTFVLDNDFRNPVFTALEAASLDLLSGGRFELGLGSGWLGSDYTKTGIPFDPPGVRVARLAEALTVIRGVFGGSSFSFEGEYYRVEDAGGPDGVLDRACPPILIGGGGRKMLTLAGQHADIVSLTPIARRDGSGLDTSDASADATDRKLGWLRDAAGERIGEIALNILLQHVTITDDATERSEALAKLSNDWELPGDVLLGSPMILIGSVDEVVATLQERQERWGISYYSAFPWMMEALGPVIARLRAA
ncbi:MAG TPA: TIGR03621 family F420-dependent LLM class oxidoreductase [Thermomicrobiales bacterium]|nr:TIGR03621 family F420-dependent LLM class oxidoreductase [Thermomicrobiales bacterium]